jgi:hypothetical protein
MWGMNRGLFSKLNRSCKKKKKKSMMSCQESPPLKESKHSLQCHPHDAALGNAHSLLQQPLSSLLLLPSLSLLPSPLVITIAFAISHCHWCHWSLPLLCLLLLPLPLPLPLPSAIAIAIVISNHHCRHLRPLL